jgi:hypothetical protein
MIVESCLCPCDFFFYSAVRNHAYCHNQIVNRVSCGVMNLVLLSMRPPPRAVSGRTLNVEDSDGLTQVSVVFQLLQCRIAPSAHQVLLDIAMV